MLPRLGRFPEERRHRCRGRSRADALVQAAWDDYNKVITPAEAAGWLSAFKTKFFRFAAWCRPRGVPYVPVVTDFPLDTFVVRVLRERGVVG